MIAAGVIGGLYILCALILLVGVREKRGEAGEGLECSGLVEMLLFLPLQEPGRALGPSSMGVKPPRRGAGRAELWVWGGAAEGQEARAPLGSVGHGHEDLALLCQR